MAAKPPPLYQLVKNHLAARISRGEFAPGEKLPSEHELMAVFNASRMTVHRALREMAAEGVLRRVQGLGSFAEREKPRAALLEITDISEDIAARGRRHHTRILALEAVPAGPLAADFALRPRAKLFHSVIVHYEDEIPIQLENRYVSPGFAPDYLKQDFTAITTNRYLTAIAPATEVEHLVDAILPDALAQSALSLPPETPILRLRRRTWTAAGTATMSVLTHGPGFTLGSRYTIAAARHISATNPTLA